MTESKWIRGLTASIVTAAATLAVLGNAQAKQLSVGVGWGLRPDMAQLGSTIVKDGVFDTASTTIAKQGFGANKVIMSDKDDATYVTNTKASTGLEFADAFTEGGSLTGQAFTLDAEYHLSDAHKGGKLPLFVRVGFYYVNSPLAEHERTLGQMTTGVAQALGVTASDYNGGKMTYSFEADWVEIPISLGINVPVQDSTRVYGGIGMSYFNGGWDVNWDMDSKYVKALTTHSTSGTATESSLGAVKDGTTFSTYAIGLNYFLGVAGKVAGDTELFLEMYASGAASTVYSEGYGSNSSKMLTSAMMGGTAAGIDPTFVRNIAYPVVFGGPSFKFGVKQYL